MINAPETIKYTIFSTLRPGHFYAAKNITEMKIFVEALRKEGDEPQVFEAKFIPSENII
jgi:hypothetical protein